MRYFRADLHLHTALSPCASEEMTPPAIVRAALERGIEIIGVCDHNSALNVAATMKAGGRNIKVIAGIEITTAEEIHVLGFFPGVQEAAAVNEKIRSSLPEAWPKSGIFDQQFLLSSNGRKWGMETKMLAAASQYTLSQSVALIRENKGLAVAAHVDRPSYSVVANLGFFPSDVTFDALEMSAVATSAQRDKFAIIGSPLITSSDSHFLSDIGSAFTVFRMEEPSFEEIALALKGVLGRRCSIA